MNTILKIIENNKNFQNFKNVISVVNYTHLNTVRTNISFNTRKAFYTVIFYKIRKKLQWDYNRKGKFVTI